MMDEWHNEPNKFDGEFYGYKCFMVRGPCGAWCGYVGLPKEHPWYKKDYNNDVKVPQEIINRPIDVDKIGIMNLFCAIMDEESKKYEIKIALSIDVHGGLTYSKMDEEKLWRFGFDCSHAGDLIPDLSGFMLDGIYRNIEFVKSEVEKLAEQLKSVESWENNGGE